MNLSMMGTKIHALEDHVIDQINEFHGIGDYAEDFIEQAHQFGKKKSKGLETQEIKKGNDPL